MSYIINKHSDTSFFSKKGQKITIDKVIFEHSLVKCHSVVKKIVQDIPVDIFRILGMRNLSAFIGELFAIEFANKSQGLFINNPHQDGYPDLLLMDKNGKVFFEQLSQERRMRDKSPFSPFANGGVEVKATCGSVPTPRELKKTGKEKPDMGDTRIEVMKSYDWKAHHTETNNLIGILWDFENTIPQIVAVFFGNNLTSL